MVLDKLLETVTYSTAYDKRIDPNLQMTFCPSPKMGSRVHRNIFAIEVRKPAIRYQIVKTRLGGNPPGVFKGQVCMFQRAVFVIESGIIDSNPQVWLKTTLGQEMILKS